ncbi:MAG: glycosyltransferase family 4 protein [Pyrinomonadaceae bacterium]
MPQQLETTEHKIAGSESDASFVKPLRVLMIAPSLDMLGGQSRQCARLREQLQQEPTLEVAFLPVNPRLPGVLRKLQAIKYVRTVVTTLFYWAALLLKAHKYDVLHIFSASYYSYMLSAMPAVLVGKAYGKKTILNYRSGEAEDHLQNWRTALPTIRMADVIVVPSGYLVELFARFDLRARAIFNIVELDRFSFRERRPLRPVFLTSRLLEPLYNVGCVLRAFALIQKRFPEASLTVAGEGFLRAELEDLARELHLRHTTFIGGVAFDKMPQMYDSADIYLTATDLDNMPSSIVECLAAGLPVVTTDAGGIPYIVTHEETCLMIPRNDHNRMAEAAIRLLEDQELASRIAHSAREHCRKFSWATVQSEWLNLYQSQAHENAEEHRYREDGSRKNAVGVE